VTVTVNACWSKDSVAVLVIEGSAHRVEKEPGWYRSFFVSDENETSGLAVNA